MQVHGVRGVRALIEVSIGYYVNVKRFTFSSTMRTGAWEAMHQIEWRGTSLTTYLVHVLHEKLFFYISVYLLLLSCVIFYQIKEILGVKCISPKGLFE